VVPDPVTLVGVSVQARPVAGLTFEVSPIRPLKPCWAATVIVDVLACPERTLTVVGAAATVKSCTV
jgi:hypothetical protein